MIGIIREAGPDLAKWGTGGSAEGWALIFLMNIAQAGVVVPVLRVADIYGLLAPLVVQDGYEALEAAATLSFVVGGDESGESAANLLSSPLLPPSGSLSEPPPSPPPSSSFPLLPIAFL